jgi:FAD/FMN-containing dehydrogenase
MKRRDFLRSSVLAASVTVPGIRAAYAVAGTDTVGDLTAVTGDGREVTVKGADVRDLAAKMRGRLLIAGDDGYDKARLILNPSFDKHPAIVAQPTGAADIQAAVDFARSYSLLLAVKCGGHSSSGQSTCERGMQIDLSSFRGARVDPHAMRVDADGGTLLGEIDHEAAAFGMVTPLGTVSHTGVGGLTLGGGFGRLARKLGMAIDNLQSVDIVGADGHLRHASEKENPDLFWAVRGGGGNFGIVTNFEFKLHPMQPQVIAGLLKFPIDRAKDLWSMYADYAPLAPDELYMDPAMVLPPGGAPGYVGLEVCYSGPPQKLEAALAPLRKLGKPDQDTIKANDYVQVQRWNDSSDSRSVGSYMKSGFVSRIPHEMVSAIVSEFPADPARMTLVFCQHCGGAASRKPENSTAFASRDSVANIMAVTGWRQGTDDPAPHMQAIRKFWSSLEPFTRGFYVNDTAREATAKDIGSNYRGNYERLVSIKKKYDPTNLFRLNANIKPATA